MALDAADGLLACPVCAELLTRDDRSLACRQAHRFDIARQGHVNLLRTAQPRHADTPAMVEARARVLASGAFDVVDTALRRRVGHPARLLDVGGGTGHHLARLLDALPAARGVSLDVSVPAARRAARAHPRAASVVADAWSTLPVRSGRFDVVTCLFAPRNMAEFSRALAPGGLLAVVTPDPEHLASVRAAHDLIAIEDGKDERLLRAASGHLEAVGRHRLRARVAADAALVADLIAMGPNAFHGLPPTTRGLDTEIAVSLWLFRRGSGLGPADRTG